MCDQEQSRNKSVLQSNNNALTNEKEKKIVDIVLSFQKKIADNVIVICNF